MSKYTISIDRAHLVDLKAGGELLELYELTLFKVGDVLILKETTQEYTLPPAVTYTGFTMWVEVVGIEETNRAFVVLKVKQLEPGVEDRIYGIN